MERRSKEVSLEGRVQGPVRGKSAGDPVRGKGARGPS
jgi:hypothetical protein